MPSTNAGKRMLITGGAGFLGRHLVRRAEAEGWQVAITRSDAYDLTSLDEARRALTDNTPEVVIHAAADVGGIGYNRLYPADIFANNLNMATSVLRACAERETKVVLVGSACAYPGEADGLMPETAFLDGPMHPSVEVYGFSKRALYLGAKAFRQQYGLRSSFLLLTNLYGPEDKFDPNESHVVAALIRKFAEATARGDAEVVCWGTGTPVREFLYVEECADAILRAVDLDDPEPVNIGTGVGTSIRELAEALHEISGFRGTVRWDTSMPDGALYKVLDTSRAKDVLGWEPRTTFRDGLARTYEWFVENMLDAVPASGGNR